MQTIPLSAAPSGVPCQRCEGLPEAMPEAGFLYLWFPLGHSLGKALRALHETGASYERLEDGRTVRVALGVGALLPLVGHLGAALGGEELRDTQCLLAADRAAPTIGTFSRVVSLSRLIGQARSGWLVELLRAGRLTSHFQPIAPAADPARPFAHEALLRAVADDGALISAGALLDGGRDAGLLFQLDLAARRSAIGQAAARGIAGKLFINFNPTAIYDPVFCLRSTVAASDAAGIARDRIVFEVTESDRPHDLGHLQRILRFYRDAGFGVALDDFGAGFSSLNLLHQLRPDYLKLDMDLLRGVHTDPYKAAIAAKILEVARDLGLRTIAEGIEEPGELAWARDHGADYVQGYLIGRPQ